jgi:hypothetical protein
VPVMTVKADEMVPLAPTVITWRTGLEQLTGSC